MVEVVRCRHIALWESQEVVNRPHFNGENGANLISVGDDSLRRDYKSGPVWKEDLGTTIAEGKEPHSPSLRPLLHIDEFSALQRHHYLGSLQSVAR